MNKLFINKLQSIGISYQEYYSLTKKEVESSIQEALDETNKILNESRKLNLHRMERIGKHYLVSEELKKIVSSINKKQIWMIITENWCGDSPQNIPYFAKIAELNPKIEFRIILRDSNPDIMDLFLTNGTRSIPILVGFDENGNELFRWGPRPKEAQKLFADLKAQGLEKSYIIEKLHLWYGRNRGKNLELELMEMLNAVSPNTI